MSPATPRYAIADKEIILETNEARVSRMTLAPREMVPWHRHGQVADWMCCLEGSIRVELAEPEESVTLGPGAAVRVEPGRPHRVVNRAQAPSSYLLVQGPGPYDFQAL